MKKICKAAKQSLSEARAFILSDGYVLFTFCTGQTLFTAFSKENLEIKPKGSFESVSRKKN